MTIFHAGFRLNGSQDPRAAEWKARQVEGRVIFGVEGGAAVVEPGQQAHEWVRIIREDIDYLPEILAGMHARL